MANITLNPGSGGPLVATDVHGGDNYQLVKVAGNRTGLFPGYNGPSDTFPAPLVVDEDGSLVNRGAVLTDEGTFRVNFANTSLFVGIGSVTVSGSTVTGTGFLAADVHKNDYFKVGADADTFCQQIRSIDSDTQITLRAAYTGTTSGTGNRALVLPTAGAGGSLSVASGALTITAGTTTGSQVGVERNVDYGPLVYRARGNISQRIANQSARIGLRERAGTPRWFAWFLVDGTTNTTAKCQTARNPTGAPSAAETQETIITLPNGATTATALDWRVEMLVESVRFFVDGVLVAEHANVIPQQYDVVAAVYEFVNGTTPASSTTATVDFITAKNHNKVEVGVMSNTEQIVAAQAPVQEFAYSRAGVIATNTILLVIDCSQIRSLSIQVVSMGTSGVITPEWSNDPAFSQVNAGHVVSLVAGSGAQATISAAGLFGSVVPARYLRLRLSTATTAGTTTLRVAAFQHPPAFLYNMRVSGIDSNVPVAVVGYPTAAASADGLANPTVTQIGTTGLSFNGTTWDRNRANTAVSVEASSAKAASGNSATALTNHNGSGVHLFVNVSAVSGTTPTLAVRVQVQDPVSSSWVDLPGAATANITATGLTLLTIYPGATVAANSAVSLPLPRTWRLAWTIGGTTPSFTFSVGAQYIL